MIALVGAPNSGKTTLFNHLTGLRAKTVNYPGSTVDLLEGRWSDWTVIDMPGVYALKARSQDEEVTVQALATRSLNDVIVVVDVTQLSRQLAMVLQLVRSVRAAGAAKVPSLVIALTMVDLLGDEGKSVDAEALEQELGVPVVAIDAKSAASLSRGLESLRERVAKGRRAGGPLALVDVDSEAVKRDLDRARDISHRVTQARPLAEGRSAAQTATSPRQRTRRIDRLALHPVLGPVIFVVVMTALFASIYWLATPLMDLVDGGFGFFSDKAKEFLGWVLGDRVGAGARDLLIGLVADGVIVGVGAVLVFVPQIFILFCAIVVLEDSGYLARAASLVDRPLKRLGLGGRSFVPLLSGFACAVPAMLAARSINSRREKFLTLLILPLMSCSARLPVYALLLGFLFGVDALKAGLALALLYFASIVSGAVAAGLVNKIGERAGWIKPSTSFLVLELPLYRRPHAGLVLKQAWMRTKGYVKRAGLTILTLSILIWAGTTFPNFAVEDKAERLETSYLGQTGKVLSPIFEPMGGDWRTGLGLISAFAAREVFVSTMAVIFHATGDEGADDETVQSGLITQMRSAVAPSGGPLFTPASVIGLLIFFVIALQCLATVAVARKEAGGWSFALWQLVAFNLVAYVLSVTAVQGLRAAGVP